MAEHLLYLVGALLIAVPITFFGVNFIRHSNGAHIGIGIYILFSVILHIVLPLWQFFAEYYRYRLFGYDIWSHMQGMWIYALSIYSVLTAYLFGIKAGRRRLIRGENISTEAKLTWDWHAIAMVATFAIAIPAFVVASYLISKIGAVGFEAYFRNRIYYRSDLGAIAILTKTMPVYAALLVMAVRSSVGGRRVLWLVTFALSTISWAAYSAATGIRFEIFSWLAAAIVTALFIAGPKVGRAIKRLVIPILVLGVLFALAGEARRTFVLGNTEQTFGQSLLRGVNGAFGNHENIVWLVENKPELTYGSNLASMGTALVPRALWPGKPIGGGPILTNIIYPGSYQIGRSGVSSLTTGFITEFYMAFGWIGVIICSLITGHLLYICSQWLRVGRSRIVISIALVATIYISIFSQFSELSQMAVQLVLSIIVLTFCELVAGVPRKHSRLMRARPPLDLQTNAILKRSDRP